MQSYFLPLFRNLQLTKQVPHIPSDPRVEYSVADRVSSRFTEEKTETQNDYPEGAQPVREAEGSGQSPSQSMGVFSMPHSQEGAQTQNSMV